MNFPGRLREYPPLSYVGQSIYPAAGIAYLQGVVSPKGGFMRGILLWLLGVPISIIILLYLFGVL